MRYIRRVLAALRKADERYGLIDEGDKILIGLSGGKDSLCLFKALSIYGKFAGKGFVMQPVILDLGFDDFNPEPLRAYCASLGYDLIVEDSRFVYQILKDHQPEGKHIPCSICSRMKKAAMNAVAHRLGFNKVAFAHHKDDAVETLFMNMVHGGRIATFEPKMYLEKSGIVFIRPLILAKENDLAEMAHEEGLPVAASTCPANGFTERSFTKKWLQSLYESHPESENNFEEMLDNYEGFKLFFDQIEIENHFDKHYSLRPLITAKDVLRYLAAAKKRRANLPSILNGGENFLILFRHQVVGAVNFRWDNPHQVTIRRLATTAPHNKGKEAILRQVIAINETKANPILFVYGANGKALAEKVGFVKKKEPGLAEASSYVLKIKR